MPARPASTAPITTPRWTRCSTGSASTTSTRGSARATTLMQQAAVSLGWSSVRVQRNVRGCPRGGEACANCGFGCPYGAKQSTARTWLADAAGRGARVVVRARAQQVRVENGAARGVDAITWEGHRITVRSRAVVAACGALHTPALLRRSGLGNEHIGKHLCIQPALRCSACSTARSGRGRACSSRSTWTSSPISTATATAFGFRQRRYIRASSSRSCRGTARRTMQASSSRSPTRHSSA